MLRHLWILLVGCVVCFALPAVCQDDFVSRARAAKNAGETDEAIRLLEEGLASDPDNASAHYILGWLYVGKDATESAVEAFARVVELSPGSQEADDAAAAIERLGVEAEAATAQPTAADNAVPVPVPAPAPEPEPEQSGGGLPSWVIPVGIGILILVIGGAVAGRKFAREERLAGLQEAVREGDMEQVKELLADGADVNRKSEEEGDSGCMPLHHAAIHGHPEIAAVLVDAGADVNAADDGGRTPLEAAVGSGSTEIAQLLLDRGVNVRDPQGPGPSALYLAAGNGRVEIVEMLVGRGADVNATVYEDSTALKAAAWGFPDVVKALLAYGADPNAGERDKPLHSAARQCHGGIVALLLEAGADAKATDEDRQTPLHALCGSTPDFFDSETQMAQIARRLLAAGVDVNARDEFDRTAVQLATEREHVALVELLVTHGADVSGGAEGDTLLRSAVEKGDTNKAEELLSSGVDANARDAEGRTPLHHARSARMAEALIDAGADLNARDENGRTPLNTRSAAGNADLVRLLISRGADPNAPNDWGETLLHDRAQQSDTEMVELLLAQGAVVDPTDEDGRTPLHQAVRSHRAAVAELLIGRGADVSAPDNYGGTPLHWAAVLGHKDLAELLLAHGSNPNARNRDGDTPLDLATHEGEESVVELLAGHAQVGPAAGVQGDLPPPPGTLAPPRPSGAAQPAAPSVDTAPASPTVGVLFRIDDIESAVYGKVVQEEFSRVVDWSRLVGVRVSVGDIFPEAEFFCVKLETPEVDMARYIRQAFGASCNAAALAPMTSRFMSGAPLQSQPLVSKGQVAPDGQYLGANWY